MTTVMTFLMWFVAFVPAADEIPFSEADVRAHPQLSEWLQIWTPPLDTLTAPSFRLVREKNKIGWPIDDFASRSSSFPPRHMDRLVYSPDSTWAVDLWVDQVDSSGNWLGEPDSHVALVNLVDGQAYLLLDCGPPCGFHFATWVSTSSFLVCGWEECLDGAPDSILPVVDRFDLQAQRVRIFHGPPLTHEYVARLESAVQARQRSWFPWIHWEQSN